MTQHIPTYSEIISAPTDTLFVWLEDLTQRLDFCIQTGLREGSIELAEALKEVIQALEESLPEAPIEPTAAELDSTT